MPFLPRSAWLDRREPDEPSPGCEFQLAGLALSSLSLSLSLSLADFQVILESLFAPGCEFSRVTSEPIHG